MTRRTGQLSDGSVDRLVRGATEEFLAELALAAYVDPLTGLLNRRALERDLPQRLAVAKRGGRPLTVVVGDLDGLKVINDRDGHPAGDLALRSLGAALHSALRGGDTAYRIGGDEFLLLLADTAASEAPAVMARVGTQAPAFSWGASTFPEDGEAGDRLVDLADQRLLAGRRQTRRDPSGLGPALQRSRRAGGALVAAAAVVTALLGGVGVGFAAENVMDARDTVGTISVDPTDSRSGAQDFTDQSIEPDLEPVAPLPNAGATVATTSTVDDAVAPGTTVPTTPVDDAIDQLLTGAAVEVRGVVDAVGQTLHGKPTSPKNEATPGSPGREAEGRSFEDSKQTR